MKDCTSKKLVLLFLAVVFTLTLASAASAQPGEFVKGVLQPLADGFPKHAITIIVVDDPGTVDGIYARSLQASCKGISPVPILVSDEPVAQGGTFDKIKDLRTREGNNDGYYPVVGSVFGPVTDLHTDPIAERLKMSPDDLNYIICTDMITRCFIQRKNAPWGKTFDSMVKYGKENPGKLRYIADGVGTGNDLCAHGIMKEVGITVKKIPMDSFEQVAATVGAGEGDFGLVWSQIALTHWQAGKIDVTLFLGVDKIPPPWDKDPNVTLGIAGASSEMGAFFRNLGAHKGLLVGKEVPKAHIDWMFKLFKAAAQTPQHMMREKTFPGNRIMISGPDESNKMKMVLFNKFEPIVRDLGMHWEQLKK
jgi:tripartite-type tricarboxylate transporter receptor subunit TctC